MIKTQGGFTLVEMLFAVALSTLIGYVIYVSARAGDEQINTRQIRMTIQESGREGLYKMLQEIRQSAPSRITIGSGGTTGSTLRIQVPDPDDLVTNNFDLNWSSAHTVQYSISGTQLIRSDQTNGKTAVIANDVTGVTFTGDSASPNRVTISLNVQRQLTNGRSMPATPLTLTAQAEVRNA